MVTSGKEGLVERRRPFMGIFSLRLLGVEVERVRDSGCGGKDNVDEFALRILEKLRGNLVDFWILILTLNNDYDELRSILGWLTTDDSK